MKSMSIVVGTPPAARHMENSRGVSRGFHVVASDVSRPVDNARACRTPKMRIEELILEGFKSYPVRMQITGWDPSFNTITVRGKASRYMISKEYRERKVEY